MLDVLVVHRQSTTNSEVFRNFRVRRAKVVLALDWLKKNNRYYVDIIIDHEVLQSLPVDGSVDDQLRGTQVNAEELNSENESEVITRTFVPLPPAAHREDVAIKNTFNRIQNGNSPITWPQISNNPVNEFQTPRCIACAFPTLYPTGNVDFRASRV